MSRLLEDYDYELPKDLIAQQPSPDRAQSRLLLLSGRTLADYRFSDLPLFLQPGDLLVLNDTRVIKARLLGSKSTGGRIEALVERVLSEHEALAQLRASHLPRAGARLCFGQAGTARVLERRGDFFHLQFESAEAVTNLLEKHGLVPLPPYIERGPRSEDERRYQTVYARSPGAVAAPTAGLHFDEPLLESISQRGVELAYITLHVGAGTFQPVRAGEIERHRMHRERYDIPAATCAAVARAKSRGGNVIAVGTTSVRALEASAARNGRVEPGPGDTDLFILPGFEFRVVDRLITNFHLPRSTLLMLVCAFAGVEAVRRAYRHAVGRRYRFFSYGDAMLVDRMSG